MQNIALSALAGVDLIFWRFYGFEKQLPHLVHSLSQLCYIFGICAVGAFDPLADLIDIDADFVDRSKLVDRNSVRLNPNLSHQYRLRDYVQQIKNPYCHIDGKTVVKITFSETETILEDCIAHYIRGL